MTALERFGWTDETARARSVRYLNKYPPISRDLVVDMSLALTNAPFLGANKTSCEAVPMSAYDPKQTLVKPATVPAPS